MHKLKSQRGETLVETMASILIAALSVALLFTCVMVSTQIDRMGQKADEAYYKALTAAETQTADADCPEKNGRVIIAGQSGVKEVLDITLYGGEGMYAYARTGEGTGP